jgi:hypothetical protein
LSTPDKPIPRAVDKRWTGIRHGEVIIGNSNAVVHDVAATLAEAWSAAGTGR